MNTDKTSQEEILVFAFVRKYCFDTIDEMIIYNDYFNESDGAVPIVLKNIQKIIIFSFGSMMFLKKVPAENDSDDSKSKMVFQRSKSTAAQKTGAPEWNANYFCIENWTLKLMRTDIKVAFP